MLGFLKKNSKYSLVFHFLGCGDIEENGYLHFVELFAGRHHLTDSMLEYGMRACAMDAP